MIRVETTMDFRRAFNSDMKEYHIVKNHRQHVVNLDKSEDLVILASSENVPLEMFSYGKNILCIMGHPERTEDDVLLKTVIIPFFQKSMEIS